MIKKFFKDITGITAAEERAEQERLALEEAVQIRKEKAAERKRIKKEKAELLRIQEEEAKSLTPKEQADRDKEPYIEILSMEVDSDDLGQGSFELDWNDIFVAKLVRAGYPGKTDQDIVDNWFKEVCRNVLMETYEQEQADPVNRKNPNNNGQR